MESTSSARDARTARSWFFQGIAVASSRSRWAVRQFVLPAFALRQHHLLDLAGRIRCRRRRLPWHRADRLVRTVRGADPAGRLGQRESASPSRSRHARGRDPPRRRVAPTILAFLPRFARSAVATQVPEFVPTSIVVSDILALLFFVVCVGWAVAARRRPGTHNGSWCSLRSLCWGRRWLASVKGWASRRRSRCWV